FGFAEVFPISAEHGKGIGEMLDALVGDGSWQLATEETGKDAGEPQAGMPALRLAIVGRPNVGKSSLLNRLLGEERAIVSPVAGTTRDSVDTLLKTPEQTFRIIDTAGIRRKGKTTAMAEKLSVIMARKSLERADVAIVLLDAEQGIAALDATIAGNAARGLRISTSRLNEFFEREVRQRSGVTPAKTFRGSRLHVQYITQIGVRPPTFVVFTAGGKAGLHFSFLRHLENRMREQFDFFATPIRIIERHKSKRGKN